MKIVFTPDWFLGKDVLIDGFSFIVLLAFSIICIKNYRLNKNRKFLYLGIGFSLISVAQLASLLTKAVLYYDTTLIQNIGQMVVTYRIVSSVDIFYYIGFFFYRLLTLMGLYAIYRLPRKRKSSGDFFLAFYFIILSAIFSTSLYALFYLTALVLLILIINNYYEVYRKNKNVNTVILISAFGMLALSNTIFILSKLSAFFVAANIIELVSYLTLLILMIRILKYGKEKKQDGYSVGYAGDYPRKRRRN